MVAGDDDHFHFLKVGENIENIIKFDFRSQTFEFDVSTRNGREELIQKLLLIFRKTMFFR
ncbi:hypothetical protein HMPREF9466_01678 [Fusobacterium necrophorum subsp. funduliforme 1_1_36S]|nr:hypothetical protein HMPREF9466_01678 [Fusobacterium necrophorum subsp. funduliforme 1_1_36S]